jgi:DNA-directed RNA polymerase subunit RPC12/RpoP
MPKYVCIHCKKKFAIGKEQKSNQTKLKCVCGKALFRYRILKGNFFDEFSRIESKPYPIEIKVKE